MKLLDSISVHHGQTERRIELYHGDLTNIPPKHAVDVLVISAYPNNYRPARGTVIEALSHKDISVRDLARNKAVDLRDTFSSWLSQDIKSDHKGIRFKRILCFEPEFRGEPSEVIGDVFQGLMPLVTGDQPITSIAMSLIATGNQRVPLIDVLAPLLDAAVHWLALGIPVECIKIVEYNNLKAMEMKGAFSVLKRKYENLSLSVDSIYSHDLFISYSHDNDQEIAYFVDELKRLQPSIRLFYDRQSLDSGAAWQHEIYDALDDCNKVLTFYSPTYLQSKVCKEEYNIALFRHRDSEDGILIPIYLYSADLPSYMQLVQYIDCREANQSKLTDACKAIIEQL